MSTVFPLSTYYMWDVMEMRPTKEERTKAHIGQRFLPDKDFGSYRVLWEEVRDFSPMAGFYSMTDLADPMHGLPWKTVQQDLLHSAARWIINPQDLMFLRLPGRPAVTADAYGTGPAAHDYRSRDQAEVAKRTTQMVEAMDNLNEYMRIHALLGRVVWPPKDDDGNTISASAMPVYWGRQALNVPFDLLAADTTNNHGGFDQLASTLAGVNGAPAAQQIAWNVDTGTAATSANIIKDFSVIKALMRKRKSINTKSLLALMSEDVLSWQTWNTNVLNWLLGTNRDRQFMTTDEIESAVKTKWGFEIETYDAAWEYVSMAEIGDEEPTINTVQYMKEGTVLVIPRPDYRGMGWMGHCPSPVNANGEDLLQWTNGRYFWKDWQTKPPFRREMGVGQFAWPLMKNLDYRFKLNAWA